jgi:diguanylate cyclase (GGDEF)-like protein
MGYNDKNNFFNEQKDLLNVLENRNKTPNTEPKKLSSVGTIEEEDDGQSTQDILEKLNRRIVSSDDEYAAQEEKRLEIQREQKEILRNQYNKKRAQAEEEARRQQEEEDQKLMDEYYAQLEKNPLYKAQSFVTGFFQKKEAKKAQKEATEQILDIERPKAVEAITELVTKKPEKEKPEKEKKAKTKKEKLVKKDSKKKTKEAATTDAVERETAPESGVKTIAEIMAEQKSAPKPVETIGTEETAAEPNTAMDGFDEDWGDVDVSDIPVIEASMVKKVIVPVDDGGDEIPIGTSATEASTEAKAEIENEEDTPKEVAKKKEKKPLFGKKTSPVEKTEDVKKSAFSKKKADVSKDTVKEEKKSADKKSAGGFFDFMLGKKPAKAETKEQAQEGNTAPKEDWRYQATHDDLTGLLNRRAYDKSLVEANKDNLGIAFVDVNNLKHFNDCVSHSAGDTLLRGVANALQTNFPDHSYRYGGDEFIVLLTGTPQYITNTFETGFEAFQQRLGVLSNKVNDGIVYSASVGWCVGDGKLEKDEILNTAEEKMYANKKAYKQAHPEYDERKKAADKASEKKRTKKSHDEAMSDTSKERRQEVRNTHIPPTTDDTTDILRRIQRDTAQNTVIGVLMADADFSKLFIYSSGEEFINDIANVMQNRVDYSYIYVIKDGGPEFYGSDEYRTWITHIFESVAAILQAGDELNESNLVRIQGIDVFSEIFLK